MEIAENGRRAPVRTHSGLEKNGNNNSVDGDGFAENDTEQGEKRRREKNDKFQFWKVQMSTASPQTNRQFLLGSITIDDEEDQIC